MSESVNDRCILFELVHKFCVDLVGSDFFAN